MVHMKNTFNLRVALQSHSIKSHSAQLLKRGPERTQGFSRGLRFDEFILRQNDLTQLV